MSFRNVTMDQHDPMKKQMIGLKKQAVAYMETLTKIKATKNPIGLFGSNGNHIGPL